MNVKRILSILGILLLIVLVGAPSPRPAGAQAEVEYGIMPLVLVNLSRTIAVDSQLAVSESNAVWVSGEGEAAEILLSDLSADGDASPRNLSNNTTEDAAPQVEGDSVVWENKETEDSTAAYAYDLADPDAEATRLTEEDHVGEAPLTSGDWVVWIEYVTFDDPEEPSDGPDVIDEPEDAEDAEDAAEDAEDSGDFGGITGGIVADAAADDQALSEAATINASYDVAATAASDASQNEAYQANENPLYEDLNTGDNPLNDGDSTAETAYEDAAEAEAEAVDEPAGIPVIYYARASGEGEARRLAIAPGVEGSEINPESLRIEDSRVVVEFQEIEGDREIAYADLSEADLPEGEPELRRLTDNNHDDRAPSFEGERVNWIGEEWAGEEKVSKIYQADLSEEEPAPEVLLDTAIDPIPESRPLIQGDRVLFVGEDPVGGDSEIYYYDLSAPEDVRQLTNNDYDDLDPQMKDERVVWRGKEGAIEAVSEVYYYDLNWDSGRLPARITDNATNDTPQLVDGRVLFIGYAEDGTTEIFAASLLNGYSFTCYYNGGDGDYYSGTFYDSQVYAEGEHAMTFMDENDQLGYYEVTGILEPNSDAVAGQVFVDSYYDRERRYTFTPVHAGTAVGTESLGSERDYIMFNGMVMNRFGIGPEGEEAIHYEADVTRAQYRVNRSWFFRSFRLRMLNYYYLRHPGYAFDEDV